METWALGLPPTKDVLGSRCFDPHQDVIDPWGNFGDLDLPSVDTFHGILVCPEKIFYLELKRGIDHRLLLKTMVFDLESWASLFWPYRSTRSITEMGSAITYDLHGEHQIWRREFQEICKLLGHHGWERFLLQPILTNSRLPTRIYLFPSWKTGNGPIKSIAPHVKDFTNLDGVFEASSLLEEIQNPSGQSRIGHPFLQKEITYRAEWSVWGTPLAFVSCIEVLLSIVEARNLFLMTLPQNCTYAKSLCIAHKFKGRFPELWWQSRLELPVCLSFNVWKARMQSSKKMNGSILLRSRVIGRELLRNHDMYAVKNTRLDRETSLILWTVVG
ncbi:hypothetical protein Tco_1091281 [Tanacetum coccineum]|uniref:Maturase n=1 Tax=Tanacetum coccineum TaxID=301880 RepID=A0ABQ5I6K6_9ASTR